MESLTYSHEPGKKSAFFLSVFSGFYIESIEGSLENTEMSFWVRMLFLCVESFECFDATWWMAKVLVKVPDNQHSGEDDIWIELQGVFPVDSEFFQI